MRWFRHNSDSHTNLKLRAVLSEFGLPGYAFYWLCLELVAQQGSLNFELNQNRTWCRALCTISGLPEAEVQKMLKRFGEIELIDSNSLTAGKLAIPKMRDYTDSYTLRRLSKVRKHKLLKLYGNVLYNNNTKETAYKQLKAAFERLWNEYPNKVGKKDAERHFLGSVKGDEDVKKLEIALKNYKASDVVKKGYIQNGKTWFNNWQDWVVPPKAEPDPYIRREK